MAQARNFAVITGVNAGISCLMKRLRGKEDVQSRWAFVNASFFSCFFLLYFWEMLIAIAWDLGVLDVC